MNLPELRRLAQAATPGPWVVGGRNEHGVVRSPEHGLIAGVRPGVDTDARDHLAAYIAALDPQTILRLLDVVEAARAVMTDDEDADPLPENEWDPRFLRLRDALAALDEL